MSQARSNYPIKQPVPLAESNFTSKTICSSSSDPSTYHLGAAADHTAAARDTLPEAAHRPAEVAAAHTDPAEDTDQVAELHRTAVPAAADRTVRLEARRTGLDLEEVGHIGLGEVHRTVPGAVRRTGLEEAAGRNLAGVGRHTGRRERRNRLERGGWSFRPWSRSCDRWRRGGA